MLAVSNHLFQPKTFYDSIRPGNCLLYIKTKDFIGCSIVTVWTAGGAVESGFKTILQSYCKWLCFFVRCQCWLAGDYILVPFCRDANGIACDILMQDVAEELPLPGILLWFFCFHRRETVCCSLWCLFFLLGNCFRCEDLQWLDRGASNAIWSCSIRKYRWDWIPGFGNCDSLLLTKIMVEFPL